MECNPPQDDDKEKAKEAETSSTEAEKAKKKKSKYQQWQRQRWQHINQASKNSCKILILFFMMNKETSSRLTKPNDINLATARKLG